MNPPADSGILCRFCHKRYPNEEITATDKRDKTWILEICESCNRKKERMEVKVEVV